MGNVAPKLSGCSSPLSLWSVETLRKKDEASREKDTETDTFPHDMITEILSFMPIKDLVRLMCVCKKWHTLIEDRHFIEMHMSRAALSMIFNRFHLLTTTSHVKTASATLICGCDGLTLDRVTKYNSKYSCVGRYATVKYGITNQATRRQLELPDPHQRILGMAFSFIPSAGVYKLVSVFKKKRRSDEIRWEVLTIGKDKSWRPLLPNLPAGSNENSKKTTVVSTGCAVHCIRIVEVCSKLTAEVVSFDMETETFTSNVLPHEMFSDWKRVWAIDWDGFLSFAERLQEKLNVMVLEDYKGLKWGKEIIVVPLTCMMDREDFVEDIIPLVAKSGNLWFWSYKKIIACDLKTMKIRHRYAANQEERIYEGFYLGPASLVSLKGMQPDH